MCQFCVVCLFCSYFRVGKQRSLSYALFFVLSCLVFISGLGSSALVLFSFLIVCLFIFYGLGSNTLVLYVLSNCVFVFCKYIREGETTPVFLRCGCDFLTSLYFRVEKQSSPCFTLIVFSCLAFISRLSFSLTFCSLSDFLFWYLYQGGVMASLSLTRSS